LHDINHYFLDRYDFYIEEPRASDDIDYYLGSDKTRRRNHDIFTTTTPLEEGQYSEEPRAFDGTGFYFYGYLQTDIRMKPRASNDIDPYLLLDEVQ
jgi:hypothetical protein